LVAPVSERIEIMPLQRSCSDRLIGGVCGGLARWLGWDPTVLRVAYVLLSIFSAAFPGMLVYIILWIVMPIEQRWERRPAVGV
jgi:phage shock protein PspC (stress-responsive transcriptional regulator)